MSLELVVDTRDGGVWLALLRDGKLIELHQEQGSTDFAVGDIYLGKVRKVVPSLNAAFVDVGYEKDAFLHYLDLGPQFQSLNKFTKDTLQGKQNVADLLYFKPEKDIPKDGKITEIVSTTSPILVQVAKEPISSKGPRLSAELTLAGRYLVLVPFSEKISISQKIKSQEERDRLRHLMDDIKPKNFGVIIRTVAENKKVEAIDQDLRNLMEKWKNMHANLKQATPPRRVLGEIDKTSSILRDLLNADFSNIHVSDEKLMSELKEYISGIAPGREKILKLYDGKLNIFERFGVNKQIKTMFGKKVPLPSGGYLIIEHTEAMHVIDVNSGNRKGADGQESNALATNIEAAEEIARLLQLRDMGGIVCIDFIDMHDKENNKDLFEKLKEFMRSDRAKHNILPPSKFGVVEITRQRVRPETDINTSETCPTCNGTGEVQASILFAEEIEMNLNFLLGDKKEKKVSLLVHPYLEAYFKKGFISKQWKWFFKYKKWVDVRGVTAYHLLEYNFLDKDNNEIAL
ncbi:Rne/Rng family ribonuclease [Fluviicola chungangensis]|uniref:Rne/Rng family ribonuclease n=1 Tax=Fluviicola chungangensis TaxID=2597671 RepID=A0A556MPT3_9FLAO|nr:Rne/Rng family ribonuclease [Fluviicola chungangensis]TSJ41961.1 Rne/Rng family ribonuclease [Fluviicola chungangensis]